MKLLNIILLTVFFIFICISLTNNIEKFETVEDEREKCPDSTKEIDNKEIDIKESDNKKDDDKKNDKNEDTVSIPLKDITSNILEHPAHDTEKKLKKQIVRPININVSYNVDNADKSDSKCEDKKYDDKKGDDKKIKEKCWPRSGDYITGTVTNKFITTGYGSQTTLGSGPVRLEFTDEYTVPKREDVMSPGYQRVGLSFGSTDNAKIPEDIFASMDADCYTLLKEKYLSFPQERYSVTDLANMGVHK